MKKICFSILAFIPFAVQQIAWAQQPDKRHPRPPRPALHADMQREMPPPPRVKRAAPPEPTLYQKTPTTPTTNTEVPTTNIASPTTNTVSQPANTQPKTNRSVSNRIMEIVQAPEEESVNSNLNIFTDTTVVAALISGVAVVMAAIIGLRK